MAYILRLNGKHLKELDGKRIKHLIYKGTVYDLSYQKLNTPIIFLSGDINIVHTYSPSILGKAILGNTRLGKAISLPKLPTPIIKLIDSNIPQLDTPIIYLTNIEIQKLNTPEIHIENISNEPTEKPSILKLDTPEIYLILESTPSDEPIISKLNTPSIYLETISDPTEEPELPEVPEEPITTHTLKIIPHPSNAIVTLTTEGYIQVDNTIEVKEGNKVTWEVNLEGYTTQTGSMIMTSSITKNVYLDEIIVIPKLNTPSIYLDITQEEPEVPEIPEEPIIIKLNTPEIYLETI